MRMSDNSHIILLKACVRCYFYFSYKSENYSVSVKQSLRIVCYYISCQTENLLEII